MVKKSFYTIGSLIILLLAAGVFVLIPVLSSVARGKRLPPLGVFAGKEIRYEPGSDFSSYVEQYSEYFKRMGGELNKEMYYYIFASAFSSTVSDMMAKKRVEESSYRVPDTLINREMMPYFVDENKKYSPRIYKSADESYVRTLREKLSISLLKAHYNEDLLGKECGNITIYGVKSASAERNFLRKMNGRERIFDAATFYMNDYPLSEAKIYATDKAELFYKYNLLAITLSKREEATALHKELVDGKIVFSDAVPNSMNIYTDGEGKIRNARAHEIKKTLKDEKDFDKLSALKVGDISDVMETSIGFTIFYGNGEKEKLDTENEEELGSVRDYLLKYEMSHVEDYFSSRAAAFVKSAKSGGFETTAENMGVKSEKIGPFPLNYGNVSVLTSLPANGAFEEAATNEGFLKSAFSLALNEISEPIVVGKYIVVLRYSGDGEGKEVSEEEMARQITGFDSSLLNDYIHESPLLENNLNKVFSSYIANNN